MEHSLIRREEGDPKGHDHGQARARGHLLVFIADVQSGEPVPYLPVTATVAAGRRPPRSVRLAPMLGEEGFHYGADVALPDAKARLTISIGQPALRIMPSAGGRFARPEAARFEWSR